MITVDDKKFMLVENFKDAFDEDVFKEKLTEYYDNYDFIVGDWAYGKLRLKGFNNKENSNFNSINNCELIESYIKDYCAFGCKYFILKRINVD